MSSASEPTLTGTVETKKFYDRISSAYDALADSNEHVAREAGLAALNVQPGEQILEIGYGPGHSLVQLAQATGPGGHVTGIDISAGMQKVALQRVEQMGLQDRIDLQVGAVPPIPLADNSLDVVSMSMTLELFPLDLIPEVLKEVLRVLKPGGRLGVVSMATVKEGDKASALEKTYVWMHTHFPHIVDCQPIPAEDLISAAGFDLAVAKRTEIWTMPVAIVVGKKP